MKNKYQVFASIFQIVVGVLAIVSFVILYDAGENMAKWLLTLVLAVAFVVIGLLGLLHNRR